MQIRENRSIRCVVLYFSTGMRGITSIKLRANSDGDCTVPTVKSNIRARLGSGNATDLSEAHRDPPLSGAQMPTGGSSSDPLTNRPAPVPLDHLAFARDLATGRLVDIKDVPRGLACNCACVSCGEVLVARQGDVVAWHFAHKANSICTSLAQLGSLDAIEAMASQLMVENPSIELPSHMVEERILEPGTQQIISVSCPVAPITRLLFHGRPPAPDSVEKQAGVSFIATIGGYRLGIILSKNSAGLKGWPGISDPSLGVVLFDLSYPSRASGANGEDELSITRLTNWLSCETGGKQWIQHPREPLARAKALRRQVAALRRKYTGRQYAAK